jgi:stage III sporulation protein AG
MDWNTLKESVGERIRKYKYFLLVLLMGILLMCMPSGNTSKVESTDSPIQNQPESLSERLESILSQIHGVGRVRVLLTESVSAETVYQTDTDTDSGGGVRQETVIVNGTDRGQNGLVRTVTSPTYLGAIVVCQGADSPSVCLAIKEAVSKVTGLDTSQISVLKMK